MRHRSNAQTNDQNSFVNFHFTTITQNCFISVVLQHLPTNLIYGTHHTSGDHNVNIKLQYAYTTRLVRIIYICMESHYYSEVKLYIRPAVTMAARRQHLYENHENDAIK